MALLTTIREPSDLRRLDATVLPLVASQLRAALIDLGSEIGGHFAGSLGTVELSVALHYVFDTPHDRVVWDVGHQGYGHKALTGRLEALRRIKKADGPSGFLRRSESPYDVFGAGHAGTSISAALGMAEAARRAGEDRQVVAVIGDGGATAGMAYEALNHAGHLGTPVRVIFNDNGMAIAPNVGGLAATGHVRAFAESLGLAYAGPVDGHDLDDLLPALKALRGAPAGPGAAARAHLQGSRLRARRGRSLRLARDHAVLPEVRRAQELQRRHPELDRGLRRGALPGRRPRSARRGHHRRHARRDRARSFRRASPGPGLRRGHRRAACGDLRGGARRRGPAAGLRHLLHLPAAGLRPDRARRGAAGAAGQLRPGSCRPGGRRRAHPPRRPGPGLPARDSEHGDRRAARRERAPAPAGHGDRVGPAVRAALPARGGSRRAHGPGAQARCGGSWRAAAGG
ncbi:MAG: hypothetical protein JRG85_14540 [Deltaproteobacteria bacterium]|nr:hypothetical protein [Deltaproteobacteria bacterium]